MPPRFSFPLAFFLLAACGSDGPTAPAFGSRMSVGDQVAIEAALDKLADTLEARGETPQDTLLADLTRIAARVIQLQGVEGTITVTLPGSATPIEMKAVAGLSTVEDGSLPAAHILVAWEWLDNVAITLRRGLVIVADDPAETGTFQIPASSSTDAVRFVDFAGGTADLYFNVAGTITVSSPSFTSNCVGLPTGGDFGCRAGGETVGATTTVSRDDGATTRALSWPAAALPAFRFTER
jgi:hypothetical protein